MYLLRTILLMISMALLQNVVAATEVFASDTDMEEKIMRIDRFIREKVDEGSIPGLAAVVMYNNEVILKEGYGWADVENKKKVSTNTFFEIGSNSKAFTATAIHLLEIQGRLNREDQVNKYIPWFNMRYTGKYKSEFIDQNAPITINQLLHHTSGIPFQTIGDISPSTSDHALEETVRTLLGRKLESYPGTNYRYATINYDVLGLVIESITGVSYEQFVKDDVLNPLELSNTYFLRDKHQLDNVAVGYKMGFFQQQKYDSPIFRGNTPAGYIITNANDLEKWLRMNLNIQSGNDNLFSAVAMTHSPDRTVPPTWDGSSYGGGWAVFQNDGGEIAHGGVNPNYSSYIVLRPELGLAVGLMTNTNSGYTQGIGQGIKQILEDERVNNNFSDGNKQIDAVFSVLLLLTSTMSIVTFGLLVVNIFQIVRGKRTLKGWSGGKSFLQLVLSFGFVAGFGYILYYLPNIMFDRLPWQAVGVWGPSSIVLGVFAAGAAGFLFYVYFILVLYFPKDGGYKPYFSIAILSILTGFGNSSIIFIINESLNRNSEYTSEFFVYFVFAVIFYVFGSRIVQARLIHITNDVVYEKRTDLIHKLLNASYQRLEKLDKGAIHTALNNDTSAISNLPNLFMSGITSLVTLLFCFVYLGSQNLYGLLVTILVIVTAAGLYRYFGKQATIFWEKNRDIQERFFSYINDLVHGSKELNLHAKKRSEFATEIIVSCEVNRKTSTQAAMKFTNVFVIGEILFSFVIAMIVFGFPTLFVDMETEVIRNYVIIILYMIGPVHGVLNFIPGIMQMKVVWRRLHKLISDITEIRSEGKNGGNSNEPLLVELGLRNVSFDYHDENGDPFSLGPVDCTFRPGEVTFVTGGNGSGKSTLVKLLTGLYTPHEGKILVNGATVDHERLGEYFSVIFSDYYLFNKIYGIREGNTEGMVEELLKKLKIDDKVQVSNGTFSTTWLSTGQRKRLALLVSYLEDKPICVYDEWAAEQDPEFRDYFYRTLLPELKAKGKCIIAITHDDRYFGLADQVIKLERGRMAV